MVINRHFTHDPAAVVLSEIAWSRPWEIVRRLPGEASGKNESAPDSIESRTLVRSALPRKLLTTTLRSDLHLRNAPFVMPLSLPLCV
jgi:hypothetical protein